MTTATLSPSSSSSSSSSTRSITTSYVPVLIAGGGPVGLFEAFLLAKLGINVRIIERETSVSPLSKALGMQPRSMEIFDMSGISNRFTELGQPLTEINFYHGPKLAVTIPTFSMATQESHFNRGIALEQSKTSEILIDELGKLGVKVDHGWELLDTKVVEEYEDDKEAGSGMKTKKTYVETTIRRALSNDNTVPEQSKAIGEVSLLDEQSDKEYEIQVVRSDYLVAADGARSTVRHKLNIGFPGRTLDLKMMMWDGKYEGDIEFKGFTNVYGVNKKGLLAFPLPSGDIRIAIEGGKLEPNEDISKTLASLTVKEFEERVSEYIAPLKFKIKTTSWLTMFKINERRAEHFVYKNRIFLAGDAAHVHSPAGGQGLNTGLQDAHNLAWKLAFVLNGVAPESLLETYEEREDMADRAITLSSKLFQRNTSTGFLAHVTKLIFLTFAPWLIYLTKVFSFAPDISMTQPIPSVEYRVGVRAREGPLRSIRSSSDLKSESNQLRLYDLFKGIGRFHILVFTSDMLAKQNDSRIKNVRTTNAKELGDNIDSYTHQWRSKWTYTANMQDGHKDNNALFKVHVISGALAFSGEDKAHLDALVERDVGNGAVFLDDSKIVHERYGFAWKGEAGGIVVVRPDSHIGYRVNGAGEEAWRDVEKYFTSNLIS
ncbi:hypothetical protein BGZ49_007337 [Haplosporangium sp. Z 27]|nr:hypothetical protein BGZ49_007337 [Haplosporangium sp. Z 27]